MIQKRVHVRRDRGAMCASGIRVVIPAIINVRHIHAAAATSATVSVLFLHEGLVTFSNDRPSDARHVK